MDRIVCLVFGLLVGFLLGFNMPAEPTPPAERKELIQPATFDLMVCRMESATCQIESATNQINNLAMKNN